MKQFLKKTMKLQNRHFHTALSLAVCQLLVACAQPQQNNYVSHFGAGQQSEGYVFNDEDQSVGKKASEKSSTPEPRLLEGTGKLLADAKPSKALKDAQVKLSFEDAPLAQVVRTVLGDILALDYVLHPPITGTVTLSTQQNVSGDNALYLLEAALQANGMGIARDARGTYHVGRLDALKGLGAAVRQASPTQPLAPGYGAIVVPLNYIGANEMAAILRPMVPGDAILRVDNVRNMLVMAGSRAQAEGWLEMVRTFDVNVLEGMSVGVFPLKYVSIQEVSAALQLMSGGGAPGAGAPGAGVAPAATTARPGGAATAAPGASMAALGEGNPLFGALRIIPIERLNSILVITPRASYLDEARRWIAKLDQAGTGGAQPQLNIYKVQNGNARHLASVLSGIFGGSAGGMSTNSGVAPGLGTSTTSMGGSSFGSGGLGSSSFGSGGFGGGGLSSGGFGGGSFGSGGFGGGGLGGAGRGFGQTGSTGQLGGVAGASAAATSLGSVRVMADELNNSVLVWGTPAEYERIEAALKKLDLPPTQVLIEASIVEVTLNDTLRYGLQWAFSGDVGNKGYSGTGSVLTGDAPGSTGFAETGGLAATLGSGFNYTVKNSLGNIKAVLTALSGKTNVKVVASPTVMVLDNHTAGIMVGTQQPYSAGSTTSTTTGVTTNIQYKDTGVILQVTPSVNSGNIVTMNVDQTVSALGSNVTVGGSSNPSFSQRQISSRVAVRSGESIVMGGLIQERSTNTRSGIPILHDLPVVGNLFGQTSNVGDRTELLVVITPRVVRTDIDVRVVSDDLREQMRSLTPLLKSPNTVPAADDGARGKPLVEVGPLTPEQR
ncbi:type II secretion system secretin GspD [Delftia acidovorans]|uniref:type II secretion system secretin GspD n=1 Tax=Delftia acidovorans TaxID=80866 RepID=UPI000A788DD6|nr:type II secretion system secretin GspD [Delftia acidovorans]